MAKTDIPPAGAITIGVLILGKKRGPVPKPLAELRLAAVKVFFTRGELEDLDSRRQTHNRPDFIRAAALATELAAPLSNGYITTWAESARIQSCLTQINQVARQLNQLKLIGSELEAAHKLQKEIIEVSHLLAEFRAALPDANPNPKRYKK